MTARSVLVSWAPSPIPFSLAAALLRLDSLLNRRPRRSCPNACTYRRGRPPNKVYKPIDSIPSIHTLGPVAIGENQDHSLPGHVSSGNSMKPLLHAIGQRLRLGNVERQLHRCGGSIDMLSTGTPCPNESKMKLVVADRDPVADFDHETLPCIVMGSSLSRIA